MTSAYACAGGACRRAAHCGTLLSRRPKSGSPKGPPPSPCPANTTCGGGGGPGGGGWVMISVACLVVVYLVVGCVTSCGAPQDACSRCAPKTSIVVQAKVNHRVRSRLWPLAVSPLTRDHFRRASRFCRTVSVGAERAPVRARALRAELTDFAQTICGPRFPV
jgi:hypothetical protein